MHDADGKDEGAITTSEPDTRRARGSGHYEQPEQEGQKKADAGFHIRGAESEQGSVQGCSRLSGAYGSLSSVERLGSRQTSAAMSLYTSLSNQGLFAVLLTIAAKSAACRAMKSVIS